jgi:hypothetical protein
MAKAEKRAAAKILFMSGKYGLDDIRLIVGVSAATITNWNREEGWTEDYDRDVKLTNDSEAIIRELIHHNLLVLRTRARNAQKRLESGDINDASEMELISAKDVDGLSKLYAQIRRKELDFADRVMVVTDILGHANATMPEAVPMLTKLTDSYIEKISFKR